MNVSHINKNKIKIKVIFTHCDLSGTIPEGLDSPFGLSFSFADTVAAATTALKLFLRFWTFCSGCNIMVYTLGMYSIPRETVALRLMDTVSVMVWMNICNKEQDGDVQLPVCLWILIYRFVFFPKPTLQVHLVLMRYLSISLCFHYAQVQENPHRYSECIFYMFIWKHRR